MPADIELVFQWQQIPETRRFSRNLQSPTFAEHSTWMKRRLSVWDGLFAIVEVDGHPSGFLRLDRRDGELVPPQYEVSIFVVPERQSLGVGAAALKLAREYGPAAVLKATVLPGNHASQRLFLAAGSEATSDETQYVSYPSLSIRSDH